MHEQISPFIRDAGYDFVDVPVNIAYIAHLGYDLPLNELNKKRNVYKEIIIEELKLNPDDDLLKHHLAKDYILNDKIDEAAEIIIGDYKQREFIG